MRRKLNVLYQASDFYTPMAGVSMVSLFENNKNFEKITIYMLSNDMGETNRVKLKELVTEHGGDLIFINTEALDEKLKSHGVPMHNGSYATFYKIFADELVDSDDNELLYIDADTIILHDLSGIFDTDIEDKPYAIVRVPMYKGYCEMIGMKSNLNTYPNCGVILFNRKIWKQNGCTNRIIAAMTSADSNYYRAADQDIMSLVIAEPVGILEARYNVGPSWYYMGIEVFMEIHDATEENFYAVSTLKKAMENPAICHCMGGLYGRPWEEGNSHPFRRYWVTYKAISPWSDQPELPRKITKLDKVQGVLHKVLPRQLYVLFHRTLMKRTCEKQFQAARK